MVVATLATAAAARTAATGGRLGGRVDWSEGLTGQGWRLGGGATGQGWMWRAAEAAEDRLTSTTSQLPPKHPCCRSEPAPPLQLATAAVSAACDHLSRS